MKSCRIVNKLTVCKGLQGKNGLCYDGLEVNSDIFVNAYNKVMQLAVSVYDTRQVCYGRSGSQGGHNE